MSQVRFVILCSPRTGSSMLTDALNGHRDAVCFAGLLTEIGWPRGGHMQARLASLRPAWSAEADRLARWSAFFDDLAQTVPEPAALGFKHHLETDIKVAAAIAEDPGVHKIVLRRRNLLARYSSSQIAAITGQGVAYTEAKTALATFDPDEFTLLRQRDARRMRRLDGSRGPRLDIDYVDIRHAGGMDPVYRFLGLDPAHAGAPRTLKRNPDDIVARFANPRVVNAYLLEFDLQEWAVDDPA